MSDPRLHTGRRALGREHFAFYRAVMEGLHVEALWDRFLSLEGDYSPALATATVQWIRLELLELAKSTDKALQGVLRRDPRKLKAVKLPSIDEFAEALDDPDFYSQIELQAMWQETYGHRVKEDKSGQRKANLVERLRRAIGTLEATYATQPVSRPAPEDFLRRWFTDRLTGSLMAVGMTTLKDLVERRRTLGEAWWRDVPRLGEVGAQRLGRWVEEHFPSPPAPPPEPSTAELHGISPTGIGKSAPFVEHPHLPDEAPSPTPPQTELIDPNGERAVLVEPFMAAPSPVGPVIQAATDEDAAEAFLNAKCSNASTRRSYLKEVDRVLLWAKRERGKALRNFSVEDCAAYAIWLRTLGRTPDGAWNWRVPQDAWIGKQGKKKSSGEWRPFTGPLNEKSQQHALVIASSMFGFLQTSGYLGHESPWVLLGRSVAKPSTGNANPDPAEEVNVEAPADVKQSKSFTVEQRAFLLHRARQEKGRLGRRLELVLHLGLACGLRASEMVRLRLGNIRSDQDGWTLVFIGKGGKVRSVPFPAQVLETALAYLKECGHEPSDSLDLIGKRSTDPLLRSHSRRAGERSDDVEPRKDPSRVGYQGLRLALDRFMNDCASLLALEDANSAVLFQTASSHWMRHTFATLMLEGGAGINVVQEILGHEDINTTGGYTNPKRKQKQKAVDQFAKDMFS